MKSLYETICLLIAIAQDSLNNYGTEGEYYENSCDANQY